MTEIFSFFRFLHNRGGIHIRNVQDSTLFIQIGTKLSSQPTSHSYPIRLRSVRVRLPSVSQPSAYAVHPSRNRPRTVCLRPPSEAHLSPSDSRPQRRNPPSVPHLPPEYAILRAPAPYPLQLLITSVINTCIVRCAAAGWRCCPQAAPDTQSAGDAGSLVDDAERNGDPGAQRKHRRST